MMKKPTMWKRLVCSSSKPQQQFQDDPVMLLASSPQTQERNVLSFSILIQQRRFDELLSFLSSPKQCLTWNRNNISSKSFWDVDLPLHCILPYHPPVALIHVLLQHSFVNPADTDIHGRNALHVACYHHCSIHIIGRLVNYDRTLNVPDAFTQRYPLHFLCEAPTPLNADIALFVRDLCPSAIYHVDGFGRTPADILQQKQHNHQGWLQRTPEQQRQVSNTNPTVLHIPYAFKETVSDLTHATFYGDASLHSKSTCSTTLLEEEEEEQFIVRSVRNQLLRHKRERVDV